ncbi:MAG TPA: glycogen-binding domain-containing protein, partial [Burkholderiaceae bacterium]|nr:glycogen-binding domain-containing protein [Burkholderiaceae bacterium]
SFALFTLNRPDAQIVYLCGNFNEWSPRSLRMFRRNLNGPWEKRVPLRPGRYQYKFIVDGEWIHDPAARENAANDHGTLNSIIEVHECGLEGDHVLVLA